MKKFNGLLFCTDLDGTLYNDNKIVSKRNLEAIEYFKAEGGLFTFITGRVPKTSKGIYEVIKPNVPYGCINGGGIYDAVKEEYLWNAFLPNEAMDLVRIVDKTLPDIGIQLNTSKEIYFNKDNTAMAQFREITGVSNISCHYEKVKEPILKVVFAHHEPSRITALKELLDSQPNAKCVDFIHSEKNLYEILPKRISKGSVLCKLVELLGVDKNKTIAVGDYYNDVSMIKMAKCGIAVENAVDEVKAVADYVTVSNNEDAIAVIIEGLAQGKFDI